MNQLEHKQMSKGNPKSPPTADKFIQDSKASTWSASSSPGMSPVLGSYHNHEEDGDNQERKSVLARVKERAKRWGRTLSKKKQGDDGTPSSGVGSDDDYEEDNAEFLGAPMYESELAPEELKETARQHPRANPVISEKHVFTNITNPSAQQDNNHVDQDNPTVQNIEPGAQQAREKLPSPTSKKTMTKSVSEKLAPAYAKMSGATNAIATKVKSLSVSSSSTTSAAPSTENAAIEEESHGRILQTN